MTSKDARVPLPNSESITADAPDLFDSLAVDDLHVARAMGNSPPLLSALLDYLDALYAEVPAELREVAILATARAVDSRYEWHQHVSEARAAGVSPTTIRAIGADDRTALDAETRALVDYVHAQCEGSVTDEVAAGARHSLGTEQFVAISLLVGHYAGTAQFIDAMGVTVESSFVGWVPAAENFQT